MPKGPPTTNQILAGEVTFVSIDTEAIQSLGYNFSAGALNQLPIQLPTYMNLQLTEIVVREIVGHRMKSISEGVEKLQSGMNSVNRHLAGSNISLGNLALDDILCKAQAFFRQELENYAKKCRGNIIPVVGENAAAEIFTAYFALTPPFEDRKDKKNEFPDAMTLWLLEKHAIAQNTKGIIVSKDAGWRAYAGISASLYHVDTIEDLTSLFAASDNAASAVKEKINAEIKNPASQLRDSIEAALREHLDGASWDTEDIYAENVSRVEAEAHEASLIDYQILDSPKVWPFEGDPTRWVVELEVNVEVEVTVGVEFFIWDSVDREELPMGSQEYEIKQTIEVDLFLTCAGVTPASVPEEWEIDVEIANGTYSVDRFGAEFDASE